MLFETIMLRAIMKITRVPRDEPAVTEEITPE
jgi:hypothetical protein